MTDYLNGFTGFTKRGEGFESAGEASRKLQEALAAGKGVPAPSTNSPIADSVLDRAPEPVSIPTRYKEGRHAAHAAHAVPSELLQGDVESSPSAASSMRSGSILGSGLSTDLGGNPSFDLDALDAMARPDQRWAWLEIDLAAIRHNVAETRRYLQPRTRLMAVVKADAYGHGAVQCSKAMLGAGADRLAVATVPEGIQLRKAGITAPIAILEQPPSTSIPLLLAYNITPTIYEPDFAVAYGEMADLHGLAAPYHLAVNTGMNRVGVSYRDVVEFLQQVSFHRALVLEGTFTHFATADSSEVLDFQVAARHFSEAIESMSVAGFDPGLVHAANSAATYRFPEVHYDMVRCGIALYGIHPCDATRDRLDIRPAMSVHARIIDTHIVPMSEGVSYGYQYRSPGSVKICTVPIGYADGLRRGLSGNIDFIIDGRYYPQVGFICMDQCMFEIDLRNRRNLSFDPQIGDHVIIVGEQGAAQVTLDELAEKAGTIPYEIAIGFAQRLARVYT